MQSVPWGDAGLKRIDCFLFCVVSHRRGDARGRGLRIEAKRPVGLAQPGLFLAVLLEQEPLHELADGVLVEPVQPVIRLQQALVLTGQRRFRLYAQQLRHRDLQRPADPGDVVDVRARQPQFQLPMAVLVQPSLTASAA